MCLTSLTGLKLGGKLGKIPKKGLGLFGKKSKKTGKKTVKSNFLPNKKSVKKTLKNFKPGKKQSKFFRKLIPGSLIPV